MGEQKTGTVFVRTKKDRNYTVIDNTFLRDDRLSAQAKGVFAYILYLPEDWCIYQSELVNHFSNGKDALRNAIKELENFGYICKEKVKNEKGLFSGWQYTVNEIPVSPKSENPISEKPKLEFPPLLNTDVISNTDNNKYSLSKPKSEPPKFKPTSFSANDYKEVMAIYYHNRDLISQKHKVLTFKYSNKAYQSIIKPFFEDYGVEVVKQAVKNSLNNEWASSTDYGLPVIFNLKKFDEYIANSKGFIRTNNKAESLSRTNMDTGNKDYDGSLW